MLAVETKTRKSKNGSKEKKASSVLLQKAGLLTPVTPEQVGIEIPRLNQQTMRMTIIGDSRLVVHKFAEKAKKQIQDKQGKKAMGPRKARKPKDEFEAAFHRLEDGRAAFPGRALKTAAVEACTMVSGIAMTMARRVFHVDEELIPIEGSKGKMRTDIVRLDGPSRSADLRYRPEFLKWKMTFHVTYDADIFLPAQIVNLFQRAGFAVGIGEGRPSGKKSSGNWGRFHVANEKGE